MDPLPSSSTHAGGVAMSDEAIKQRLKGVFVYGLSDSEENFASSEAGNSIEMYFNEGDAKKRLEEVKLNYPGLFSHCEVVPFALSKVLKLMEMDDESSFVFIPEPLQIQNAVRKITESWRASAEVREEISLPADISIPDVPVFKANNLQVKSNGTFCCPLYFRLEDLHRSLAVTSGKPFDDTWLVLEFDHYEVVDLMTVTREMKGGTNTEWNDATFIRPGKDLPTYKSADTPPQEGRKRHLPGKSRS